MFRKMEQLVACPCHKREVGGSSPSLATITECNSVGLEYLSDTQEVVGSSPTIPTNGPLAQLNRATAFIQINPL